MLLMFGLNVLALFRCGDRIALQLLNHTTNSGLFSFLSSAALPNLENSTSKMPFY
jgi:hypothetical protein